MISCSENLYFMSALQASSVDLIYSDVLYGTGKNFVDFQDIKAEKTIVYDFYVPRFEQMSRILKKTGSIYIQCDTKINHWLRDIMDNFFIFRNEIVWNVEYRLKQASRKYTEFGERILFYTASDEYYFNPPQVEHKTTKEHQERCRNTPSVQAGKFSTPFAETKNAGDVWNDVKCLTYKSKENTNYPTQKPLKLMERIVSASSKENDLVADFFMGSGSFLVAGKKMNRNILGCDISNKAYEVSKHRLNELL